MDYGFIRAAAAVPKTAVANLEKNTQTIFELIEQAHEKQVQVIAFPELSLTSYSLGDLLRQPAIIDGAQTMLSRLLTKTASFDIFCVIGLPVLQNGRLYNCAAAFQKGKILGVVPKSHIPNYSEFYEQRWFSSGEGIVNDTVMLCGEEVPFGIDLIFHCENNNDLKIGIEVCEDMWVPFPRHTYMAVSGANMLINISASSELVGKAGFREEAIKQQSSRCISAFIYVSAGPGESSTDSIFGGHTIFAEDGDLLQSIQDFSFESRLAVMEFDLDRLMHDRMLLNRSWDGERKPFRLIPFRLEAFSGAKYRKIPASPFVPEDDAAALSVCRQAFQIQTTALAKRMMHTRGKSLVIGVSGGLDSALALMVAAGTVEKCGLKKEDIHGVVMPGMGSTEATQSLAKALVRAVGASVREIPIINAVAGHLSDIGHTGKPDIAYENAQARERTQILMDLANMESGLVIGTGDLSELALGFCTYNGDHMSMYGVNAGLPKTLIREMVLRLSWDIGGKELADIAREIVSIPPSPELLPPTALNNDPRQDTEKQVGPYEINDFFLYYLLRYQLKPEKLLYLSTLAFEGKYTREVLQKQLDSFYRRFFASQYKRSCSPDAPKILDIGLSPRGDWRMPSDAEPDFWLI
jgi:NAD+ synthase (glutamine-hydrolysing)